MLAFEVEGLKDKLATFLTPLVIGLFSKQEVEVKPGVFMTIAGDLTFTIQTYNNGLHVIFKLKPQLRVHKLINLYGELTGLKVTKDGIELEISGLPNIFLTAK